MLNSWLVVEPPTPLKNDGVKVSWDDDISNIWKNKIHVPNHQPDRFFIFWAYYTWKFLCVDPATIPGAVFFKPLLDAFHGERGRQGQKWPILRECLGPLQYQDIWIHMEVS